MGARREIVLRKTCGAPVVDGKLEFQMGPYVAFYGTRELHEEVEHTIPRLAQLLTLPSILPTNLGIGVVCTRPFFADLLHVAREHARRGV